MIYLLPGDDLQLESRESIKKSSKTQQEIKKYTIEEDLGELKRTTLILSKGEPIQRRAIIESLEKTAKSVPALLSTLLPIVKQIISTLDLELQYSLVAQIIELVPVLDGTALKDLTGMCLVEIGDWKSQKLSLEWLRLFGILVRTSIFNEFQQEALQISLKLSSSQEILPLKMIAVRMLGHLSFFMKNRLKGTPLDRIRSFCRDPDIQLRLILAKEVMPLLFENLGIQLINIYFMERMFEMIYDTEMEIKMTTIDLFLEYYGVLSIEDKERFSKIIMEHLEDPTYSQHLSLKMGVIYEKIRFQLERRSDMGSLINCFISFLSSQEPKVRHNALYNLPGLLFYMGLKIWSDVKKHYFNILVQEEQEETKRLAVVILPQILKIMEVTEFQEFPIATLNLIKSLNIEFQEPILCLLDGLPGMFEAFKRNSLELQCNEKDNSSIEKTLKSMELHLLGILKAEITIQEKEPRNHYIISKFHSSITECIKFMNSETLIDVYFPLLCQGLMDSNGITIEPLLDSACQLLYELVSKVEILPLVNQINRILYDSSSLFKVKYLKFCTKLLSWFSIQKYKELCFFEKCIKLWNSPVLCVRMQVVLYLQQARYYVLQEVDQTLNKLFQSEEISQYLQQSTMVVTSEQREEKKRRNSECLKNEETQFIISSKKKIDDQKKRNFIIKPGPLSYKKALLKYNIGAKNLTSSSTSSHSLVPSFSNTNRSQVRTKAIQEIKQTSKSIRKIINNKMATEQQKQQVQKRKFRSVEISLQKSIGVGNADRVNDRKRRKTIFEKKEGGKGLLQDLLADFA